MTMEKLLKDYTTYYETRNYAPGTVGAQRAAVVTFINYMKEKLKIRELKDIGNISLAELETFKGVLQKGYNLKRKELSPATVKGYFKAIRHFLRILSEKYGLECKAIQEKEQAPDTVEQDMRTYPEEFKRYFEEYIEKKRHEAAPFNSMKKLKESIRNFYRYLTDQRKIEKLSEIRKEDVRDYAPYLSELTNGKGEKAYLAASVNRYTSDLRHFLRWLHKKGVCAPLSSYFVHIRMEQHLSRNILTRKEIVRLFNVKAKTPYEFMAKTACVMLYGSGLRLTELLTLRKEKIDFEKKEAYIYEGKTRKERVVPLGDVGMEYLKLYLEHVRHLVCKGFTDDETVFVSMYEGKLVNTEGINRNLKRFCKKADIRKRISCHCFRHSFGTHLLEAGAKLKQVSDLLGHTDLSTTEKYVRLNPEQLRLTVLKYHPRESGNTSGAQQAVHCKEG